MKNFRGKKVWWRWLGHLRWYLVTLSWRSPPTIQPIDAVFQFLVMNCFSFEDLPAGRQCLILRLPDVIGPFDSTQLGWVMDGLDEFDQLGMDRYGCKGCWCVQAALHAFSPMFPRYGFFGIFVGRPLWSMCLCRSCFRHSQIVMQWPIEGVAVAVIQSMVSVSWNPHQRHRLWAYWHWLRAGQIGAPPPQVQSYKRKRKQMPTLVDVYSSLLWLCDMLLCGKTSDLVVEWWCSKAVRTWDISWDPTWLPGRSSMQTVWKSPRRF